MKVLALNGSPRHAGATARILEALVAGMSDAGADARLVHLGALHLAPCTGCYACWVRTPGQCIHRDRDGMAATMERWRDADVVVFGTPVYHCSMTGLMKTFLDRLLPELEPWLREDARHPGDTVHPRRHRGPARAMLVAPCGFPEPSHFGPLVHTFRHIAERNGWAWMGELLRPGAEPLARPALGELFAPYLADVRRAGAVVVRDGRIPGDLAVALGRDLLPGGRETFHAQANRFWEELMDSNASTLPGASAAAPGPALEPPPSAAAAPSCRALVAEMPARLDRAAAADLDARIEFRIGGAEPGLYHLLISGGACLFCDGPALSPGLVIEAPAEVWASIAAGRRDGRQALMEGAYRARGDLALLVRMRELFPRDGEPPSPALPAPRPRPRAKFPAMGWLLVAFAPWKAFWVALGMGRPRAGLVAGLATALVLWAFRRRGRRDTWFEQCTVAVFAIALALAFVPGVAPERRALLAASFAALSVIWAVGAAARPLALTGEYSRWKYAPALVETALFRRPNVAITLAWSATYLAQTALLHLDRGPRWRALTVDTVQVAIFVAAVMFTRWQEKNAPRQRVEGIERRLAVLRGMGWALAGVAGTALVLALL